MKNYFSEDGIELFVDNSKVYVARQHNNDWMYDAIYQQTFNQRMADGSYQVASSTDYKVFSSFEARLSWMRNEYPNPILKSTDNEDIFIGDKVFFVQQDDHYNCLSLDKGIISYTNSKIYGERHIFKSQDKALDFLLTNDDSLSIKDITKILNLNNEDILKLKDFIKSRGGH